MKFIVKASSEFKQEDVLEKKYGEALNKRNLVLDYSIHECVIDIKDLNDLLALQKEVDEELIIWQAPKEDNLPPMIEIYDYYR